MGKVKRHTLGASLDRKSGSAGMPRPISYAVFCLKKKKEHRPLTPPQPADAREAHMSASNSVRDASARCLLFTEPAASAFYTLSLHDALPISTASISKESPAITGVVEMVIRRPI